MIFFQKHYHEWYDNNAMI